MSVVCDVTMLIIYVCLIFEDKENEGIISCVFHLVHLKCKLFLSIWLHLLQE